MDSATLRRALMPCSTLALVCAAACSHHGAAPPSTSPSAEAAPAGPVRGRVQFIDRNTQRVGTATLEETPSGVLITAELEGLPPGYHGFHIHSVGQCDPPFTSAGGHFNPDNHQHGTLNPNGPHAGDLANLYLPPDTGAAPPPANAAANRRAAAAPTHVPRRTKVEVLAAGVTLSPGPRSLLDADGSALVVHAAPDDYTTDPSGNSGERIACGIITRAQ